MHIRSVAVLGLLAITVTGCDKLRAATGSAEGGTSSPSIMGEMFGSDFEGEITSKMTPAAKPADAMTLVFGIKKPKVRIDMSNAQNMNSSMIMDTPTKKGWMLMHPQKMAMALDLSQPIGSRVPGMPTAPKGAPTAPSTPPKVEKTGKKETIAGYTCEDWVITSEGKKAEVCMAENLNWIDVGDLTGQPQAALLAMTTEGNHFPLKVVTHDAKGVEEMRMEAQKIEKKKLEDTRFAPPPDYKQINMGAMNVPGAFPTGAPPGKH